jgi:heme/copper-type cytochrome/quinol oxidase subunit 2
VAKFAALAENGSMLVTRADLSLAAMLAVVVVFGVLATALWVYRDARAHAQRGTPFVYAWGAFEIATPAGWFLACALLFEMFIPAYLDNRRPA